MNGDDPKRIDQAAREHQKALGLDDQVHESRLRQAWAELLGPKVAARTTSIAIRDARVFVRLSSGPLKQELLMKRSSLLAQLNEALGENYLVDIIIR